MVHKRPFGGEDTSKVACKHARQLVHNNQLASNVEIVPWNNAPQRTQFSDGEGEETFSKSEDEGRNATDSVTDVSNGSESDKDFETSALGNISSFLWLNSSTIEEDTKLEDAFNLSFFPEYFEIDCGVRGAIEPVSTFSSLLDHSPRKLVSIGPDHQAHIPEWAPYNLERSLDHSDTSDLMNDGTKEEQLMGTIVIPMPDWEPVAYNCCKSGETRSECNCLDAGSISCTRLHVMEARQRLRENLGQDMFDKLGFCDMGEEVANKWSEDEEYAFYEVVLSYPVSLDKNFWDHIEGTFPSRTKKDLVSYYFNVFKLCKRAEQNRFDPLNIDSDNDEWQRIELGTMEEEKGSPLKSQIDQDALNVQKDHEEGCLQDVEDEMLLRMMP